MLNNANGKLNGEYMDPRRNTHSPAPASAPAATGITQASNNGILNTVLVVLLIITAIIASAYLAMRLLSTSANGGAVKGSEYQALFLTNGQVYFGHLSGVNSSYVKLKDIYYLQVQQQVQPGQQPAANNQQQPNVSLAKLGSELHGPEDTMYVSQQQVLFWENLKADGKVSQAIKDYKAKK